MKISRRRILFRRSYSPLKTSAEIILPRGAIRIRIEAPYSPQERRALLLAMFRASQPWLKGIRKFDINHFEFIPADRPYSQAFLSRVRKPISTQAHRFGCIVRLIRLHSGWTLHDLSRASKISASHLSEIERGLRRVRFSTHLRLERALGTPLPNIPKTRKPENRGTEMDERPNPRGTAFTPSLYDLIY